jgi:hypothetical protein
VPAALEALLLQHLEDFLACRITGFGTPASAATCRP